MAAAKIVCMLSPSERAAPLGVPRAATASVPRLAWLAQPLSAPIVPAGSAIVHSPPRIITIISAASPSVSATRRRNRGAALAYAEFTASAPIQRTLYTQAGGQPGHRAAWLDADNNRMSGDYFSRTLPALDRAYLRPRDPGQPAFQERAGPIVHAALRGTLGDKAALEQLNALQRAASRPLSAFT